MTIPHDLALARKELPSEVRRFVTETMHDIELRLIAVLPKMGAACESAPGKQSTFTPTITLKSKKNGELHGKVAARVRMPDEERTFRMRMKDGQLELVPVDEEEPAGDEEETEPDAAFNAVPDEPALPMDGAEAEPAPKPPAPMGPMTPAQKRLHEIRQTNIALAKQGKLTPAQMETAGITAADLAEDDSGLSALANA